MRNGFLVETCLLCHGLCSVTDEEMYSAFSGIPAAFAWISGGKVTVGELEEFMKFRAERVENRASVNKIEKFCAGGEDAALTASGTMEICRRNGIPLAVTCGMGGIGDIPGDRISSDLPALTGIPVPLLATSPKDMLDIGATIRWLQDNGVKVLGYHTQYCTGYVFNSANEKLDGSFDETADVLYPSRLLLNPIAHDMRIKDLNILRRAINAAENAAGSGGQYHPAANAELDRLTDGRTSRLQMKAVAENAKLAAKLTMRYL